MIKNCNKSEISEKFSDLLKKITENLRSQIFDKKNIKKCEIFIIIFRKINILRFIDKKIVINLRSRYNSQIFEFFCQKSEILDFWQKKSKILDMHEKIVLPVRILKYYRNWCVGAVVKWYIVWQDCGTDSFCFSRIFLMFRSHVEMGNCYLNGVRGKHLGFVFLFFIFYFFWYRNNCFFENDNSAGNGLNGLLLVIGIWRVCVLANFFLGG